MSSRDVVTAERLIASCLRCNLLLGALTNDPLSDGPCARVYFFERSAGGMSAKAMFQRGWGLALEGVGREEAVGDAREGEVLRTVVSAEALGGALGVDIFAVAEEEEEEVEEEEEEEDEEEEEGAAAKTGEASACISLSSCAEAAPFRLSVLPYKSKGLELVPVVAPLPALPLSDADGPMVAPLRAGEEDTDSAGTWAASEGWVD